MTIRMFRQLSRLLSSVYCKQCVLCRHQPARLALLSRPFTVQHNQAYSTDEQYDITKNPLYDKYANKLKQYAMHSPDEFQSKTAHLQTKVKEEQDQRREDLTTPPHPDTATRPEVQGMSNWPPASLDDIMHVDLAMDKTAEQIEQMWIHHHSTKDGVFAVFKADEYNSMMNMAMQCPLFIYPLPQADGYEFMLSQFSGNNVYFTSLHMYQLLKENSPTSLSLILFTDFIEQKGIVLMAGKFDDNHLSQEKALNLVRQMTMYYSDRPGKRRRLVETFNKNPEKFDYNELVTEYKTMQDYVEI